MREIRCRRCDATLTQPLQESEVQYPAGGEPGEDLLTRGQWARSDTPLQIFASGNAYAQAAPSHYAPTISVCIADVLAGAQTSQSESIPPRAIGGCCGLDGLDGPNQACTACGSLVGTLRSDCWCVHEMRYFDEQVTLASVVPPAGTAEGSGDDGG